MVLRFWRVLTISSSPTSRPIGKCWHNILPVVWGVEEMEEGARLGDRLEVWGGGALLRCESSKSIQRNKKSLPREAF